MNVTDSLALLKEKAAKTEKLRAKLMKKLEECNTLASEITAIGIIEVSVSLTEESLK